MLISAPVTMTTLWINPLATPDLSTAWLAYLGQSSDAITSATMLDLYRTEFRALTAAEASQNPLFTKAHLGLIYGYEWVALAYLIGGLWLIYQRVITWHTPVGLLVTLTVVSAFFGFDPDTQSLAQQVRRDACGLRSGLAFSHTLSGRMGCIQMLLHLRCYR